MFAFRKKNTKRKVQDSKRESGSSKKKAAAKSKKGKSPPAAAAVAKKSPPNYVSSSNNSGSRKSSNGNSHLKHVPKGGRADDNSTTMSLYTTQSKSTRGYPPNYYGASMASYGLSEDLSEFRKEIALARLGGLNNDTSLDASLLLGGTTRKAPPTLQNKSIDAPSDEDRSMKVHGGGKLPPTTLSKPSSYASSIQKQNSQETTTSLSTKRYSNTTTKTSNRYVGKAQQFVDVSTEEYQATARLSKISVPSKPLPPFQRKQHHTKPKEDDRSVDTFGFSVRKRTVTDDEQSTAHISYARDTEDELSFCSSLPSSIMGQPNNPLYSNQLVMESITDSENMSVDTYGYSLSSSEGGSQKRKVRPTSSLLLSQHPPPNPIGLRVAPPMYTSNIFQDDGHGDCDAQRTPPSKALMVNSSGSTSNSSHPLHMEQWSSPVEKDSSRFTLELEYSSSDLELEKSSNSAAAPSVSPSNGSPSGLRAPTGPIDLDESIADSESTTSDDDSQWDDVLPPPPSVVREEDNATTNTSVTPMAIETGKDLMSGSSQPEENVEPAEVATIRSENNPPTLIVQDDDDDHQHLVWTDSEGSQENNNQREEMKTKSKAWNDDDDRALTQSYQQTMASIGGSSSGGGRSSGSQQWASKKATTPGTVLLTSDELETHSQKYQYSQPLPSSTIEGYDQWRRHKEFQQRYFAKLQEKAEERKRERRERRQLAAHSASRSAESDDQRQPQYYDPNHQYRQHPTTPPRSSVHTVVDSTRSAMETSMDSTIPTVDAPSPRRNTHHDQKQQASVKDDEASTGCAHRWRLFSSPKKKKDERRNQTKTASKTNGSNSKKKSKRSNIPAEVVPLDTFMRISSDEPLEVAELSLSPLNKIGHMTLGTGYPDTGETLAATQSHYMDERSYGGPKHMALLHLEEERRKQQEYCRPKPKPQRTMITSEEEQRIQRLKEKELERQRRLNLPPSGKNPPRTSELSGNNNKHKTWDESSVKPRRLQFPEQDSEASEAIPISRSASEDSKCDSHAGGGCSKQGSSTSFGSKSRSSSSSSSLAPCIVCNNAERTHIAMPCMHFSFCGKCTDEIMMSHKGCPICRTTKVTFSKVYTA